MASLGSLIRRLAFVVALAHMMLASTACDQAVPPQVSDARITSPGVVSSPLGKKVEPGSEPRRGQEKDYPCEELAAPRAGTTRVELWFSDRHVEPPRFYARALVIHRDLPSTTGIAAAALEAWINGPTKAERKLGARPIANEETELLGLNIEDGAATVDVSGEFHDTGLGTCCEGIVMVSLVGILTQFPTIERVFLHTEGKRRRFWGGHGGILDPEGEMRPDPRVYRIAEPCP